MNDKINNFPTDNFNNNTKEIFEKEKRILNQNFYEYFENILKIINEFVFQNENFILNKTKIVLLIEKLQNSMIIDEKFCLKVFKDFDYIIELLFSDFQVLN